MWRTLLAFGIICLVWGSINFAIRVGVREVPQFLFAAQDPTRLTYRRIRNNVCLLYRRA